MDLLKEEEALTKKLAKARESVERKEKYLAKIQRSLVIAQREVKADSVRVRKIRRQIRVQGIEDLTVPESLDYPDENTD